MCNEWYPVCIDIKHGDQHIKILHLYCQTLVEYQLTEIYDICLYITFVDNKKSLFNLTDLCENIFCIVEFLAGEWFFLYIITYKN